MGNMSSSYVERQKSVLSLFGYTGDGPSKFQTALEHLIRVSSGSFPRHIDLEPELLWHNSISDLLEHFSYFDCHDQPSTRPNPPKMKPVYPADIGILPRHQHFSVFKKKHAEEAAIVYNFLISRESYKEFEAASMYFQGILNMELYIYALTVALAHREDVLPEVEFPPIYEVFPSSFIPISKIRDALAQANESTSTDGQTKSAAKFQTGSVRDPEFKVAWWREDIGLNVHHCNWHKVYPHSGIARAGESGPKVKERQGELFYYMHHQMLARYDTERIAVGLMRVLPYSDWNKPIKEGYNSHLTDYYGTSQFAPRPSGMILSDTNFSDNENYTVAQHHYNYHRLLDAINTGKFKMEDGTKRDVEIDSLGSAVESSIGSPNTALYGSLHNMGHDLLGVITDPDGRYGKQMGVMGDTKTACRDPVFYRWHKFIDNLFELHKAMVPKYQKDELLFKGINVSSIDVQMTKGKAQQKNVLKTSMGTIDVSVGKFLFQRDEIKKPEADVQVRVDQLNHEQFHYNISVHNGTRKEVTAVFRIFLAPRFDEHGVRYQLKDQRKLFIELDRFVEKLAPGPKYDIKRFSSDSSVVMPPSISTKEIETEMETKTNLTTTASMAKFERTHRSPLHGIRFVSPFDEMVHEMVHEEPATRHRSMVRNHKESRDGKKDSRDCRKNRYCKCGWPPNLLIPRGTESGMAFDLFVMVTNWSDDRVPNNGPDGDNLDQGTSYCGSKNKKYPDKRPMGFPFDRPIDGKFDDEDGTIDSFINHFSNMTAVPIKIVFDKSK